jgi:hypothetical protein
MHIEVADTYVNLQHTRILLQPKDQDFEHEYKQSANKTSHHTEHLHVPIMPNKNDSHANRQDKAI